MGWRGEGHVPYMPLVTLCTLATGVSVSTPKTDKAASIYSYEWKHPETSVLTERNNLIFCFLEVEGNSIAINKFQGTDQ